MREKQRDKRGRRPLHAADVPTTIFKDGQTFPRGLFLSVVSLDGIFLELTGFVFTQATTTLSHCGRKTAGIGVALGVRWAGKEGGLPKNLTTPK